MNLLTLNLVFGTSSQPSSLGLDVHRSRRDTPGLGALSLRIRVRLAI